MKPAHLAACLTLIASIPATADDAVSKVFRQVRSSIVTVHAGTASQSQSQGSGFVISRSEIATNCHVLGFHPTIRVKHEESFYPAKLSRGDYAWDVCVLAVEGLPATPLKINVTVPDTSIVGKRVVAIGSPMGFELTVSEGIVSSLRRRTPADLIQTTAAISPGSSGGPLLTFAGEVIGITTMQIRDAQSINFAVSSYILKVLGDEIRYWSPSASGKLLDLFYQRDFSAIESAIDRLSRDRPQRLDRHLLLNLAEASRTEPLSQEEMGRLVRELDKSLPFFAISALQMEQRNGSPGSSLGYVARAVFRILGYRRQTANKADENADDAWKDMLSLSIVHMTTELIRSFAPNRPEQITQMQSGDDMLQYLDRAVERVSKYLDQYPNSCPAKTSFHTLRLLEARLKHREQTERAEFDRLRELIPLCPNSIVLHRILYSYSANQQELADSIRRKVRQIRPASERELAFVDDFLRQASSYVRGSESQLH